MQDGDTAWAKSILAAGQQLPKPRPEPMIRLSQLKAAAAYMNAKGYRFSDDDEGVKRLDALRYYLKGYSIGLIGSVGTGKTMFFDCVPRRPIRFSLLDYITESLDDIRQVFKNYEKDDIVIDDIGSEPVFNHYGDRFDILPIIINWRERLPNVRTHFTSNHTGEEIYQRYGERIEDRLYMAKIFTFGGASLRRPTPVTNHQSLITSYQSLITNH